MNAAARPESMLSGTQGMQERGTTLHATVGVGARGSSAYGPHEDTATVVSALDKESERCSGCERSRLPGEREKLHERSAEGLQERNRQQQERHEQQAQRHGEQEKRDGQQQEPVGDACQPTGCADPRGESGSTDLGQPDERGGVSTEGAASGTSSLGDGNGSEVDPAREIASPRAGRNSTDDGRSSPCPHPTRDEGSTPPGGDDASPVPQMFGAELAQKYEKGHVFAVLRDPDDTWEAIFQELTAHFGSTGYRFNRNNNSKVPKRKDDDSDGADLRWSVVKLDCESFGEPRLRPKVANAQLRRQSSSKKCGCRMRVIINWNNQGPPKIGDASVMVHSHPPPENTRPNEMSREEVEERECDIREHCKTNLSTASINGILERDGMLLGHDGKKQVAYMVSKIRGKHQRAKENDSLGLLDAIQSVDGNYLAFKLDAEGLLERVFWAYPLQRANAVRFGSVVIFDTTFHTNDLGFSLVLMVTVDSENKTRIVCQALLRNEQTDSFSFVLQHYSKLRHGLEPETIFTDADNAMTAAIAEVCPLATHLYCIWHTIQNIMKRCKSVLQAAFEEMLRHFRQAAYCPTIQLFNTHWQEVIRIVRGTAVENYMADFMFKKREKWAFCFHPGALTLGITSTQRVEGINRVLKLNVTRYTTLPQLDQALRTVEVKLHIESERVSRRGNNDKVLLQHPSWSSGIVSTILHQKEPIGGALVKLKASKYALDVTKSEAVAAMTYGTEQLAKGRDAVAQLLVTLKSGGGGVNFVASTKTIDLHDFDQDGPDCAMYARTSLPAFLSLLSGQDITAVYKVFLRTDRQGGRAHLVVTGPRGFSLCSCLHLLRTGRLCRHFLAVMTDFLGKCEWEFDALCLHPRWRDGGGPWSMAELARKTIQPEPSAGAAGGAAGDCAVQQEELTAKGKAAVAHTIYADWLAVGKGLGQEASTAGISVLANERLMAQMKAMFSASLKAEVATAKTACSITTVTFSGTRDPGPSGSSTARGAASEGGQRGGVSGMIEGRGRGGRGRGGRGRGSRGRGGCAAVGKGRGGNADDRAAVGGRGDGGHLAVGGRGGCVGDLMLVDGGGVDVSQPHSGGLRESLHPVPTTATGVGGDLHRSSACTSGEGRESEGPIMAGGRWIRSPGLQQRVMNVRSEHASELDGRQRGQQLLSATQASQDSTSPTGSARWAENGVEGGMDGEGGVGNGSGYSAGSRYNVVDSPSLRQRVANVPSAMESDRRGSRGEYELLWTTRGSPSLTGSRGIEQWTESDVVSERDGGGNVRTRSGYYAGSEDCPVGPAPLQQMVTNVRLQTVSRRQEPRGQELLPAMRTSPNLTAPRSSDQWLGIGVRERGGDGGHIGARAHQYAGSWNYPTENLVNGIIARGGEQYGCYPQGGERRDGTTSFSETSGGDGSGSGSGRVDFPGYDVVSGGGRDFAEAEGQFYAGRDMINSSPRAALRGQEKRRKMSTERGRRRRSVYDSCW